MRSTELIVHVVDDDPSVRDSLALMLELAGYRIAVFPDAESFLEALSAESAGCVLADLRLPGKSGVELQAELKARGFSMPVIIITAHGDVQSARTAFHANAVDFLEKPFDQIQLTSALERAFQLEERRLRSEEAMRSEANRIARLTVREREVLEYVARGLHAKEIGVQLGISARTVEVHKAKLMSKLGVRNVAELVRFALARPAENR